MLSYGERQINISSTDKKRIKDAQTNFTVGTMSSFRINDSQHFTTLCQEMMYIGSKYGIVETKHLFSSNTIAKNIYDKANDLLSKLYFHLNSNNIIEDGFFSLMSDILSTHYSKNSYLQLHIQWIDENFELHNAILSMEHFPMAHTNENIKNCMLSVFEKVNISPSKARIVTDCGSNMLLAVKNMKSYACSCHRLSTVIEHMWKNTIDQDTNICELNEMVNKLICSLNHKIDIQVKLKVRIHDSNQTRAWRGLGDKLSRVLLNYEILSELAATYSKIRPIFAIDKELLQEIVQFLNEVNTSFDTFENEKLPTFNMITPIYFKLLNLATNMQNKNSKMSILATNFIKFLKIKFEPNLTDETYAATLLSPNFRQFKFIIDEITRNSYLDLAKSFIQQKLRLLQNLKQSDTNENFIEKKIKTEHTFGEDSSEDDISGELSDELSEYLKLKIPKINNPLLFWQSHETQFPLLSIICKQLFSIAAFPIWADQ